MARAPDKRIEQAKALYLQGKKLVDIAEELGLPEGTVRSWKNRYKWDGNTNATLQKKKRNVAKEKAAEVKAVADEVNEVLQNTELTDKQQLFCLHYIRCFNATKAYQKAYECGYDVANAEGYKLLVNPCVRDEIQRLKQNRLNREMLSEHDIFQKYLDIAYADITDYVSFGTKEIQYTDKAGNEHEAEVPFIDLKESSTVDGTLLTEISQGKEGIKIKLADKMKALDWLSRHTGMATPEQRARLDLLKAQTARISQESAQSDKDGAGVHVEIYLPEKEADSDG